MAAAAAAILARVSDDQGGRSASVSEQLQACRSACVGLDWEVVAEHTDDGISASRFANGKARPGWEALKLDITSGTVSAVCLWETSRGSREMSDWAAFLNLCRSRKVIICVVSHGNRVYHASQARDRRTLLEDGVDAEYESEKASERVRRGVHGALAAGRPVAAVPFGYRKLRDPVTGRLAGLEPDPDGARTVRMIFAALAAGVPVAHAARAAGGMTRQKVLYIAKNPSYIAQRKLANGTYVGTNWEPVIGPGIFWEVQEILRGHRGAGIRPGASRSLLGYLAVCGKCGEPITTERRKGTDVYRCRVGCLVYGDAQEADNRVMFSVVGLLETPGVLERFIPADAGAAAVARAVEAQLRERLDGAVRSYVGGRIPVTTLEAIEADLRPKLAQAAERARRASVPPVLQRFAGQKSGRYAAAYETWCEMPLAAQRDLLRTLTEVVFYPTGWEGRAAGDRLEVFLSPGWVSDERQEITGFEPLAQEGGSGQADAVTR